MRQMTIDEQLISMTHRLRLEEHFYHLRINDGELMAAGRRIREWTQRGRGVHWDYYNTFIIPVLTGED